MGDDVLIEMARQGDLKARQTLIENHLPIAWSVRRTDERAEALFGLVEGVDRFLNSSLPPGTLSAYLKGVVMKAINDVVRNEARHDSRLRRALSQGLSSSKAEHLIRRESSVGAQLTAKEELAACCWNDLDFQIVNLRLQDLTIQEAADILGISFSTVQRALGNIKARLQMRARTEDLCDDPNI